MTFSIMVPATIVDAWLDATNVPETDYTAWSAATAYVVGNFAMVAGTTHHNYKCIQAHTNFPPTTAANIGVYWTDAGATNTWKPFDKIISSLTTKSGDIAYRLGIQSALNTVAIFGATAGSAQVILYDTGVSRVNLATYSDEFDNAAHVATRCSVTANLYQDPLGSYQADALFEGATLNTHFLTLSTVAFVSGTQYTISIYAKQRAGLGDRDIVLELPAGGFTTVPTATFTMSTGTTAGTTGGATQAITAADAYGYYRLSITATANASGTASPVLRFSLPGTGLSYTGNSVAGFQIYGYQANTGAIAAYQWIRGAAQWGAIAYNSIKTLASVVNGAQTEAIFTGIPGDVGDYMAIALYAVGGTAQVGEITMGLTYTFGFGDVTGCNIGYRDYSSQAYDTYGNAIIVRRAYSKTADYTVAIDKVSASQAHNFLTFLRSVPVVWYDSEAQPSWGTSVFGFVKEFSIAITGADQIFMSVRVDGII